MRKPPTIGVRICGICGQEYLPRANAQKYCSNCGPGVKYCSNRNSKAVAIWNKRYRLAHIQEIKDYQKVYQKNYDATHQEEQAHYNATHLGEQNEWRRADRKMHPERERMKHTKRRTLGFIPLNSWFPDADAHHLDHDRVAYIPHMIHKSVSHNVWTGRGMEKINALALQYLAEAQP